MVAQVVAGTPVEAAVLARLLELRDANGEVSNREITEAAQVLGKSPRTIRRMISRGYVRKQRSCWVPDQATLDLLQECEGSVAQVQQRLLKSTGAPPVSLRTMQRAVERRCDQFQVTNARKGYAAMAATLPTMTRAIAHRNDEWAIDHTLVPVFVLVDGHWCKPWMTTVLDAATRMVLAFTLSPNASTLEETVETLAAAAEGFTTPDGTFVGGTPRALMSDRGGDLVTRAVTTGLLGFDVERRFTEAYTPHQNGRIERWHRTLKEEMCRPLVGYDRSDHTARDPRAMSKPLIDPRLLMPIETLRLELVKAIDEYNFDRQHSKLRGRTPFEAWAADEAPIEPANPDAIRAAMTQSISRVVTRGTIQWDNRKYELPHTAAAGEVQEGASWREVLEGKYVTVRFLPTRPEFVHLETQQGISVGRATWDELLDEAEATKKLGVRRKAITTSRTSMEDRARAEAESIKALAARAAEIAEVEHDDETVDYGPRPDHKPEKKRPETSRAAMKKTKAKQQRDTTTAAVSEVILAKTGTDDLGF